MGSAACAGAGGAASSPNRPPRARRFSSCFILSVFGMAGEGEEDVVEVGGVHRQPFDRGRLSVETVEDGLQRPDAAINRDVKRERLVVARGLADGEGGRIEAVQVGESQADVAPWDA